MELIFTEFESIHFETTTNEMVGCTTEQIVRYYKGVYTNKERFINRFTNPLREKLIPLQAESQEFYDSCLGFVKRMEDLYDGLEAFSLRESFELENREFQALVFASIDISEMISQLGATRIKTDGIGVNHRQYDFDGKFTGLKEYHNVYETYAIDGTKLGIEDQLYAVKCWCTSTDKEHWIWIDDKFKDDPLNAIASTFVIHENLIPHITALKRQGDLLLVEMEKDIKPEGELVSLNKDQYFGLLVAQS